jgi:hypothetical protein
MSYIALQLVGIQAVIDTIGLCGSSNAFLRDLPLIIAFAVLAADRTESANYYADGVVADPVPVPAEQVPNRCRTGCRPDLDRQTRSAPGLARAPKQERT